MKQEINFLSILLFSLLFSVHITAQSPNSDYVIQEGDWLSKISSKAYDNPHLYYRIMEGTNSKAKSDGSYHSFGSANDLQVGQKIWIPNLETGEVSSPSSGSSSTNMTDVPDTNCEIRLWYNFLVVVVVCKKK